jgi:LysM repeat protein
MHPNDSLLLIRKPIVIEIKIKDSLNTSILVSKEIPIKKDVVAKEKAPVKPVPAVVKPKKPEPKYYVVKKGDNLSRIANKYKTSVKALQLKNKLKTDFLQIGQKLLIP